MKRPDQIKNAPDLGPESRVPPGQFLTNKFPVLTYGPTPKVKLETWKFKIFGLVEQPLELNWEGFNELPWTAITADFHCVTQWSALDNTWEGVRLDHLLSLAKPLAQANFVMAHCEGGYTTNLPLDLSLDEGFFGPQARWQAAGERPRLAPPPDHSKQVRLEERQVAEWDRTDGRGQAGVLGRAGLQQ